MPKYMSCVLGLVAKWKIPIRITQAWVFTDLRNTPREWMVGVFSVTMDRRGQQAAVSISRRQQLQLSQCMYLNCHTLRYEGRGKANWIRLHATCSIISKRIFHCDIQPGLPLGLSYFPLVDLVRPVNLWSATKEQTKGWIAPSFHPRISFNHTGDLPPTVGRAPAVPTLSWIRPPAIRILQLLPLPGRHSGDMVDTNIY